MHPTGHKSWVEINGENLKHNIKALRSLLLPGVTFCAVVKANAYGHDLDTIVRLCSVEGVTHFAVDSIDEALVVQKRAPEATVFIVGYTTPERLEEAMLHNFIINVYAKETLKTLAEVALKHQRSARVNLKVETGTQRQGILGNELEDLLNLLKKESKWLTLEGMSSHFANAEQAGDSSFTEKQNAIFQRFVETVQAAGLNPPYVHTACSAAGILYKQTQGTMVRFGISLYGLWSDDSVRLKNRASDKPIDLRPVMSIKSRIAQVKDVPPHTPVGYGCSFVSSNPMRIAVIPFGYYDGYKRGFRQQAHMLIKGQACNVVGTICMNMCMVDVSHLPHVKADDRVTLMGIDGMNRLLAETWAEWGKTINYEVVTHIGAHVPRVVT